MHPQKNIYNSLFSNWLDKATEIFLVTVVSMLKDIWVFGVWMENYISGVQISATFPQCIHQRAMTLLSQISCHIQKMRDTRVTKHRLF